MMDLMDHHVDMDCSVNETGSQDNELNIDFNLTCILIGSQTAEQRSNQLEKGRNRQHKMCYQASDDGGLDPCGERPAAAAAKSLQSCLTLCDPIDIWQPTRLPRPWDSPGKNTGVGCHFLLQCMQVKSESEVTQSCPTLSDPTDCSLLGSSIHGIFQTRVQEWGAIAFSSERPGNR